MPRPSEYTEELAMEIAARMVEDCKSLRSIAEDESMPSVRTLVRWCREHPAFDRLLAHARMAKADLLVDEVVEISDEPVADVAQAARNRLRVQARLDAAAKLHPARYAAKLGVGMAFELPSTMTPAEAKRSQFDVARRLAFALAQGLKAGSELNQIVDVQEVESP